MDDKKRLSLSNATSKRRHRKRNRGDWVFRGSGLESLFQETKTRSSEDPKMEAQVASEVKKLSPLLAQVKASALGVDFGKHASALESLYNFVWDIVCSSNGFDGVIRCEYEALTANQKLILIQDNESMTLRSIVGEKKFGQTSITFFDGNLRKRHVLCLSSQSHRDALFSVLLIARAIERGRLAAYRAIFSSAFIDEDIRQLETLEDADYTTCPKIVDNSNENWQFDDFFAVAALASLNQQNMDEALNNANFNVKGPKLKIRVRGNHTTDIKLVTADGRILDDKTRCFSYEPKKRILKAKRLECVTRSRESKAAARRRALVFSTLIGSLCLIHLAPAAIMQYWGQPPPNFFTFASYAVHADEFDFPFIDTPVDKREQTTILLLLVASLVVGCLALSLTELELWAGKDDKYIDFTVVDDEVRVLDEGFRQQTAFHQGQKKNRKIKGVASILMQLADDAQPLPKRKLKRRSIQKSRAKKSYFTGFSSAGETDTDLEDECHDIDFPNSNKENLLKSCRFPLTFSGRWIVDNSRSDDPNLQLKALGVPWALRHALVRSPNVKRIIFQENIWTEEAETVLVSKIQHLRLDGCRQIETHPIDGTEVYLWSQVGTRPSSAPQPPPNIPLHCQLKYPGDSVISVILYSATGNLATIVRTLEDCGLTYHVQNQLYIQESKEFLLTHTFFSRHRDDPCLLSVPPDQPLCISP